MSKDAKNSQTKTLGKPRETMPAPVSAGAEAANAKAREIRGLPFDPHDFPIRTELPARLEGVTSVETLHRLQRFDTRNNAAAVYERRIDELRAADEAPATTE